ncbi:MAG TPA: hypothetical protein DCE71_03760 [Parachlamydiales bacterium]|nr:hypothetical protein [Parachlamydiales bacterium]
MKHKGWMICSGLLWMAIGLWLLAKGIFLIAQGCFIADPQLSFSFQAFGDVRKGATSLISLALLIGFIKGRFVLSKTVRRVCLRIASLPLPIRAKEVYSTSYIILILGMMALGMALKFLSIPLDLKGALDIAVGSALLNGSILYFRAAFSLPIA